MTKRSVTKRPKSTKKAAVPKLKDKHKLLMPSARLIDENSTNHLHFIAEVGQKKYIPGKFDLYLLKGDIEINGALLSSENDQIIHRCYNAISAPLLPITNCTK
jgi:hypothetical protein